MCGIHVGGSLLGQRHGFHRLCLLGLSGWGYCEYQCVTNNDWNPRVKARVKTPCQDPCEKIHMWRFMCDDTCVNIFICEYSRVRIYCMRVHVWWSILENKHGKIYVWGCMCEKFTSENPCVKIHMWRCMCEDRWVKIHMENWCAMTHVWSSMFQNFYLKIHMGRCMSENS